MKHQEAVQFALRNKAKLYVIIRYDGYVLDEGPYVVQLFTWEEIAIRNPGDRSWRYKEVDPYDPADGFNVDFQGTFWDGPIPYGRGER